MHGGYYLSCFVLFYEKVPQAQLQKEIEKLRITMFIINTDPGDGTQEAGLDGGKHQGG